MIRLKALEQNRMPLWLCLSTWLGLVSYHLFSLIKFPQPFVDESVSLREAYRSLGHTKGGFFEPLYELTGTQALNTKSFGMLYAFALEWLPLENFVALRSMNFLFGMLLLLSCFCICKKLAGIWPACFAIIFIAFSEPFVWGAHVARPDIFGTAIASVAFLLSLSNKRGILNGLACGLLVVLGFELHVRASVIGIILALFHLYPAIREKQRRIWMLFYVIGGAAGLLLDAWGHGSFQSESSQTVEVLFQWRAPALFSFSAMEIASSLKETLVALMVVCGEGFFLFLLLPVLFFSNKKDLAVLGSKLLLYPMLAGSLLIVSKVHFKTIAFTPFIGIAQGIILYALLVSIREFKGERLRFIVGNLVIFAVIFSVIHISRNINSFYSTEYDCFAELESIGGQLQKEIEREDSILGEELYWPYLKENTYASWKAIALMRNYKAEFTPAKSIKQISPNVMILDGASEFHISDEKDENRFNEGLRVSRTDLEQYFEEHAIEEKLFETRCFRSVRLIRFSRATTK